MTILFNSGTREYSEFSNFAAFPFELDGLSWPTAEHYYQAHKFSNQAIRERIRMAPTASQAKKLSKAYPLTTPNWDEVKDDVMERALSAKFDAHPALKDFLLSTGDEELVEHSPWGDEYWGNGKTGTGQNKLGKMLMVLRGKYRDAA